jgi:AcrR family transcriptional regulator
LLVNRHLERRRALEDIVEESELSKGGVYWYFASKDELVAALVQRLCAGAISKLRHLVALGGSATDRLRSMGRAMSGEIRKITRIRAVTLEFNALGARDPRVRWANTSMIQ